MKAMILAAGRGKRMGELTQHIPKPLLKIAGKTLIEWQIMRLKTQGFSNLVINVGYLGQQIIDYLGDGNSLGVSIQYSIESQQGLETGGGVFQALPLLGDSPFLLTNADVFCDYPYKRLKQVATSSFHLVLVNNPAFKKAGDFSIKNQFLQTGTDFTFAGISVVNPAVFQCYQAGFYPIAPLFHQAIKAGTATAEIFSGSWQDIGTPERLMAAANTAASTAVL